MANRFLVGTAAWSSSSAWATTTGGAPGAAQPTAGDDVFIDANSGTNTVTLAGTNACRSINATGAAGATVAGTGTLNVGSSTAGPSNLWIFLPASGLTWTYTGTLSFVGTNATAQQFTSNGLASGVAFTINGAAGTLTLLDNFTTTGALTLTGGTLSFNGKTLQCNSVTVTSNSTTRVFALGAGALTCTPSGSGTVWNQGATLTGFSMTGTGTVTINMASASAATVTTSGASFAGTSISWVLNCNNATWTVTGAATWYNLTINASATATHNANVVTFGASVTVSNTFTVVGTNTSPNRVVIKSDVVGTARTITAAAVSLTNVSFLDITGAGAATWSGTSVGTQVNTTSGITGNFNAGRYAVAAGNWSAIATWANAPGGTGGAIIPTANDDVFFAAGAASGTYTADTGATRVARSMDFTGSSGVTFAGTATVNIGAATRGQGDIALKLVSSGLTWTYTGSLAFVSTVATAQTLTSAGLSFASQLNVNAAGSTVRLADTLVDTSTFTLTNGTFDMNGQTATVSSFTVANNSNTRVFAMGTNGSLTCTAASATAWSQGATLTGFSATGTGTVTISENRGGISTNGADLRGGGITFALTGSGAVTAPPGVQVAGGGTFYNLTWTGTAVATGMMSILASFTVTNLLTITGFSATQRVIVRSDVSGTSRTITAANVSLSNVDFSDITGAGAATWTGTLLGDALGNSGITFAAPVTNYWITGTGVWDNTAHWASASGGVAGTGRMPLPQDSAVFDSSSGTGTVSMSNLSRGCASVVFTSSSAITINNNAAMSWYGSFDLGGRPTINTSTWTFVGRGSHSITTGGGNYSAVKIDTPTGTYTLADHWISNLSGNSALQLVNGTLTSSATVEFTAASGGFTMTGGTLNMGSTTWLVCQATAAASNVVWNVTGGTINGTSATISFGPTGSFTRTFIGGGQSYGSVVCQGGFTITGANSFVNFTWTTSAGKTLTLPAAVTQTITGSLTLTGVSGTPGIVVSSVGASAALISAAAGVTIAVSSVSLQDNTASGGASFIATGGSTRSSNVTGWTLNDTFSFSGSVASAGSVVKSSAHGGLAGSISSAGALTKSVGHGGLAGSISSAGALAKSVGRSGLAGSIGSAGALVRQARKVLSGKILDPYPVAVNADAPVAYWRLGESSGSVATDATGHGNDGTYDGVTSPPVLGVAGAIADQDTAALFSVVNGTYGRVPYVSGFGSGDCTYECWVKTTSIGGLQVLVHDGGLGAKAELSIGGGGYAIFAAENDASASFNIFGNTRVVADGTWHHVSATKSGTTVTLRVDGVVEGTVTLSGTFTLATDGSLLGAGGFVAGGTVFPSNFLDGALDEVAIYPTALSGSRLSGHEDATSVGSLSRSTSRAFSGGVSSSGQLSKTLLRALSGVSGPSGALTKQVRRALTGQVSITGGLARLPEARFWGATQPSGDLRRGVSRSFLGELALSGVLRRGGSRSLQGSIPPQGTLAKTAVLSTITGAIAPSGDLLRVISRRFAGLISAESELSRVPARSFDGSVASGGTLATTRTVVLSLAGAIAPAGELVRVISRRFVGSVTPQGQVARKQARSFSGGVALTGSIQKQVTRSFAGSLGLAGVVVRRLVTIRPIRIAVSALSPHTVVASLGPAIVVSPDDPVITTFESGPMLLGPAQIAAPGGRNLTVGVSDPRVSVGSADESLGQETEEVTAETTGDLAVIETEA